MQEEAAIESTPNKLNLLKYFILKGMSDLECAHSVAEYCTEKYFEYDLYLLQ